MPEDVQSDCIVDELHAQYLATLEMLEAAVRLCPENLWTAGEKPFWREAFHGVFWTHNFAGGADKRFEEVPFGKDIDPRLFTPPNNTCSREEALTFIEQTREHVDAVFGTMRAADLEAADGYGRFRNVLHRLLYSLRHTQHHVGMLHAALRAQGCEPGDWKG
jgi:hypothetical protein